MTVAIVPLKPRAEHKVLVRITGSGTAFDDKAIPHTVDDSGGTRINYETSYRGRAGSRSPCATDAHAGVSCRAGATARR